MKIDVAQRRRVMQRSMHLGHCICDPRRPCPCDVFTQQGYCPCAGERPDAAGTEALGLTSLVHNPGCASKIPAGDLDAMLSRLPPVRDPDVLCGLDTGDDAGVYRLHEQTTLVQTVDVMTPCVDDARTFGRICAVHCLSDIYAMGGTPRTALSILAFPSETLSSQIMFEMMQGAMEALAQERVALLGGHSIKDQEIKLGFAVTGTVDPQQVARRDGARVGDVLVLTKPLGTGVLSFARQVGRPHAAGWAQACAAMLQSNRAAAQAMTKVGVSACTDVTGYGLLGHLAGMLRRTTLTAEVNVGALPAFDGVIEALGNQIISGAIERNREFVQSDVTVGQDVDETLVNLALDPQTSGGLLLAVAPGQLDLLLHGLAHVEIQGWVIGRIVEPAQSRMVLTGHNGKASSRAQAEFPRSQVMAQKPFNSTSPVPTHSNSAGQPATTPAAQGPDPRKAFAALMLATSEAGAVDARTKALINFALVVLNRCAPCVKAHHAKALQMGITAAELDEAAWCAAAMGGAPVRAFYDEALKTAAAGDPCCAGH